MKTALVDCLSYSVNYAIQFPNYITIPASVRCTFRSYKYIKMKTLKLVSILAFCLVFLFSVTSCVVLVKKDNGNHKGWYKNPKNPHNPNNLDLGSRKGNKNK